MYKLCVTYRLVLPYIYFLLLSYRSIYQLPVTSRLGFSYIYFLLLSIP